MAAAVENGVVLLLLLALLGASCRHPTSSFIDLSRFSRAIISMANDTLGVEKMRVGLLALGPRGRNQCPLFPAVART